MNIITSGILSAILLTSIPQTIEYKNPEPAPVLEVIPEKTPYELVDFYADKWGIDKELLHKVVKCESSYRPDAVNWSDSHKLSEGSHGIAQFSKETFKHYGKDIGLENGDPYNPSEALDVMGYMISIGQGKHWTCYRKNV
ncbi:MAG: transglycosylase SLT domain-containing protein [Candidatus Pacearchaeota archaeon]